MRHHLKSSQRNFPGAEIDKILTFLADLLSKSEDLPSTCNQLLYSKVTDILVSLDRQIAPRFFVHFVSNTWPLADHEYERCQSAVRPYRSFTISRLSCRDLAEHILLTGRRATSKSIRLVDTHHFDRSDGMIRGLIGIVSAEEVVRLVQQDDDPGQLAVELFENNVRVYLGLRNRINRKIYDTALSDRNYEF